ncbi:inorganic phosphate transporter [Vibrio mediterranei]|uniref:inorganic phosphate transporter n=1 Tax=Vibrio mediterranei TaxID=689 RepID=UPI0022848D97|nr:inorganic phosphate transporter [Vibrio mediterranei]MCY9852630.1 inorganic phosphate transporter [Vibrio mediterranei]
MDILILIFLSSGLFLGWALGANDAANVFGTAVGSRMVRFSTAAIIASIFVILGATLSGSGAAHTLGKLGAVNALGGAFVVSLSAALTVLVMTKFELPVSTGQAVVGAIIGWNIFVGIDTETTVLFNILMTWVLCPVLSAVISIILYQIVKWFLNTIKLHILTLDWVSRTALIVAGAFGSYSLGANNIANVMGVFINAITLDDLTFGNITFNTAQQLFFVGALAIAIGIFTYSKRVMLTVGNSMMPLTPITAGVVVMAHSIVLFLFASEGLEYALASRGLPTIPLVPVSSSQAVVGAIIGIGLLKGGQELDWRVLGRIVTGWVTTPPIAMASSIFLLFFLQNVFSLMVYTPLHYQVNQHVQTEFNHQVDSNHNFSALYGQTFTDIRSFKQAMADVQLNDPQKKVLLELALIEPIAVDFSQLPEGWTEGLSKERYKAVEQLDGAEFQHAWQLLDALSAASHEWQMAEDNIINKQYNKRLKSDITTLLNHSFIH